MESLQRSIPCKAEMNGTPASGKSENNPVYMSGKRNGREESLIDMIYDIKREIFMKKRLKRYVFPKGSRRGKHSGSVMLPPGVSRAAAFSAVQAQFSDIDIAGTVRSAAPSMSITSGDIRLKKYRRKRRAAVLFVIDASRSQGSKERLAFAKGAVCAVLERAYCERDRAGAVIFSDCSAEVAVPFTGSAGFAAEIMEKIKAKGNTPLAMGLRLAFELQKRDILKHGDDAHITVLITDGKSNYDSTEGNPLSLAAEAAEKFRTAGLPLIVADTENSIFGMGLASELARVSGAEYISIM